MKSIRIKVTIDGIHHAEVEVSGVEFMKAKDQDGLLVKYLDMLFAAANRQAGIIRP